MKPVHHKGLTLERWAGMPFCERMANVGSEVHRAISWRERNPDYSRQALERALELLDLSLLTVVDQRPRLRELARVRETLVDYFVYENQYGSSDALWQKYFDAFAHAAAVARH
jgi:hypothetical protein